MRDEVTVGTRAGLCASTVAPSRAVVPQPPATARLPRRFDEGGAVSAEAAVVLPLLVALALSLVWLVSLAVTQVRVVDAAREAARSAARGESDALAVSAGNRVAPAGASIQVSRSGDEVQARVSSEVHGPGGLLAFLPPVEVTSTAVAAQEPQ
jgi:Flp pilus assembly protein TadG